MSCAAPQSMIPLAVWQARRAAHLARVEPLLAARRTRAAAGIHHPVEDFLFTYYPFRLAALARWSPGWGVVLEGQPPEGERGWSASDTSFQVAASERDDKVLKRVQFIKDLCAAVARRPAFHGCYGLHEWAMVYGRSSARRHTEWPLRLGAEGTDAVVAASAVCCSHFDAFRFFTPDARPLNRLNPDREGRIANEQPGCIHVTMDLYKWTMKLGLLMPAELAADTFALAADARAIDMRASPYDFSALGYEPIKIETPEGRLIYEREQRRLATAAAPLRARLLAACAAVLEETT